MREREGGPSRRPEDGRSSGTHPEHGEPRARAHGAEADGDQLGAGGDRILIVDDEAAIRLVCRLNLNTVGFETIEAADGEAALEAARAEQPDLILLDIMLPSANGFEVAEDLMAAAETRAIPIVFITARSERADEQRGYDVGGVGYVTKPFDPEVLGETVRATLDRVRRGEREELRAEWRAALEAN